MKRLILPQRDLVIDYSVRNLCRRAYPNHPKGCPNAYKNRKDCPPQAPKIEDFYDLYKPVAVIWVEFDFLSHRNRMKQLHPKWSERQVDCCLYWQSKVNKQLKWEVGRVLPLFYKEWGSPKTGIEASFCPEAMGVNVTATMARIGVRLEWPPKNIVRKVALIGVRK